MRRICGLSIDIDQESIEHDERFNLFLVDLCESRSQLSQVADPRVVNDTLDLLAIDRNALASFGPGLRIERREMSAGAGIERRTRLGRNSLLPRLRTTVFQIVKALQPLPQHLDLSAR